MNSLITVEQLQEYTGVYPDEDGTISETYCEAATDIVKEYLGYDPTAQDYTKKYDGNGNNTIYAGVQPVNSVSAISIDGDAQDLNEFDFYGEEIYYKNTNSGFPTGKRNVSISFNAGYTEIPQNIVMATLRIAALLQTEGQNNIGITSKSWDGEGSRTFVNYTNFDKYLLPISSYKVVR